MQTFDRVATPWCPNANQLSAVVAVSNNVLLSLVLSSLTAHALPFLPACLTPPLSPLFLSSRPHLLHLSLASASPLISLIIFLPLSYLNMYLSSLALLHLHPLFLPCPPSFLLHSFPSGLSCSGKTHLANQLVSEIGTSVPGPPELIKVCTVH